MFATWTLTGLYFVSLGAEEVENDPSFVQLAEGVEEEGLYFVPLVSEENGISFQLEEVEAAAQFHLPVFCPLPNRFLRIRTCNPQIGNVCH